MSSLLTCGDTNKVCHNVHPSYIVRVVRNVGHDATPSIGLDVMKDTCCAM